MEKDLRNLLKTGVFGVTNNGENFVVVGESIIYQKGGYDVISIFDGKLSCPFYEIEKLIDACSFNNLNTCLKHHCRIIYDRKDYEPVEMTIEEIEKKLGIKNLKIKKEGI